MSSAGLKIIKVAVKKRGDDITFLRRIVRGGADESYGIEVAKLAGIPNDVVRRSKQILKELDAKGPAVPAVTLSAGDNQEGQLSLSAAGAEQLREQLCGIDVDTLTPLEALTQLYNLVRQAQQL